MPSFVDPLGGLDGRDRYLFQLFASGTTTPSPFATVHEAFMHHAAANPEAVAVLDKSTFPERTITYGKLLRHTQFLAKKLVQLNVKKDVRVPLVVRRSIEMAVGILGILMAGGQYVPLDGSVVPAQTLDFVFDSCGDSVPLLATSSTAHRVRGAARQRQVLVIEDYMFKAESCWQNDPLFEIKPSLGDSSSGCYVIYTSGTTGNPKGVDVSHRNVTNLLCLAPGNVGMQRGSRVSSVLSISFDMGAWEVLGAFCNGSSIVMRGSNWRETLSEIDTLICTPTILSGYNAVDFPNIKFIATAGERLPQSVADEWSNAGKTLFTGCGPTEVTIVNTLHVHDPTGIVSIGRPTPNNRVYVLDEDQRPVPIGATGTLWAGRAGITRGYVGLPEKTAEGWRSDPFANDGSVMFDTGDLGYWLPNGTLQVVGRKDDQIKVKGFRIELDGVSASLASCPGVNAAVAIFEKGEIHGFITPATCSVKDVLDSMKSRLPYYAIPSTCTPLTSLPVTPNGKIDKRSLKSMLEQESIPGTPSEDTASTRTLQVSFVQDTKEKVSQTSLAPSEISIEENPVPAKKWPKVLRNLRLRVFIVYRTIFSLVWLLNILALVLILVLDANTQWLERMAFLNLTFAVLMRQDHVINLLYSIWCSIPQSWPLSIRKRAAKIYHFGGAHSGAASIAVTWYLASLVYGTWRYGMFSDSPIVRATLPGLVLSWFTVAMLFCVMGAAYPTFRKGNHDLFEMIHRFVGWTALAMIWAYTLVSSEMSRRGGEAAGIMMPNLGNILVNKAEFWLLVTITGSIALSWITLRKVSVDAEVLSDHAVRLHFDYAVPVNGSFVRLSVRPLLEWHSFATIGAADAVNDRPKGFSLVVSNAGNWTKDMIHKPRSSIWVRGVPTCGVMRIATLFRRIVLVGTGSGIGPLLGFVEHPTCPYRLIWSTKKPESTFGSRLCKSIRDGDPEAVIHDTAVSGRPDLLAMTWREVQAFQAEAVIVIANEKLTKKVVYGLESRDIPAFGAIWDS